MQEPDFDSDTTAAPDGYRVSYTPTDGGQSTTEETTATEFSVQLEDLMMGTEYTITVWGFNSAGDGSPRDVTEATDIDRELMRAEGGRRERERRREGEGHRQLYAVRGRVGTY